MKNEIIKNQTPSYYSLGDNVKDEQKENKEKVTTYKIGSNTYEVHRSYCNDGKDIIELLYEQYLLKKTQTI